ncbi:hypothetical protein FHW69_001589 [Luteibacter sp. Sphag1AF]|nr:hypothetical protein [Luteibacter sp. Sphag1AF]
MIVRLLLLLLQAVINARRIDRVRDGVLRSEGVSLNKGWDGDCGLLKALPRIRNSLSRTRTEVLRVSAETVSRSIIQSH